MNLTAPAWQDQASCRAVGGRFHAVLDTSRRALCDRCPVWRECLEFGLHENDLVWGGLDKAGRARLRRLAQRFKDKPSDPANGSDVCRLAVAGMPIPRLAVVLGVTEKRLEALAARTKARRRRRSPVGVSQ